MSSFSLQNKAFSFVSKIAGVLYLDIFFCYVILFQEWCSAMIFVCYSVLKTDQAFCSHFLRSDTDKQIRFDQRFTKTQDKNWTGVWLLEHIYPRICNFRKVRQHLFVLTFIFLCDHHHLYWGLFEQFTCYVTTCRCDVKWKIWKWALSKECQRSEGKNFNKLLIIRK